MREKPPNLDRSDREKKREETRTQNPLNLTEKKKLVVSLSEMTGLRWKRRKKKGGRRWGVVKQEVVRYLWEVWWCRILSQQSELRAKGSRTRQP